MSHTLDIIVPVFNEEVAITPFARELFSVVDTLQAIKARVLFVNDGSTDKTQAVLEEIAARRSDVLVLEFSRNFGKEAATTSGLHESTADAVVMIDADLQHPPHHLPAFVAAWQQGADVVVGVRTNDANDSRLKRFLSRSYYKVINVISDGVEITPRATDYRLLDRRVVAEFVRLTERRRMTRGLIDWLGFRREYIYFDAPDRQDGRPGYTLWKLIRLASESVIAMSSLPLRLAGYLGFVLTLGSGVLGSVMFVDRFVVSLGFEFSGSAMLATLILFMVGVVLMALGLLAFYIGFIYTETQNRPLYVVRSRSAMSTR